MALEELIESLMTDVEIGAQLKQPTRTIRKLASQGLIPVVRVPGTRGMRFRPASVAAAIRKFEEGNGTEREVR